jgi:hypothetical protein
LGPLCTHARDVRDVSESAHAKVLVRNEFADKKVVLTNLHQELAATPQGEETKLELILNGVKNTNGINGGFLFAHGVIQKMHNIKLIIPLHLAYSHVI